MNSSVNDGRLIRSSSLSRLQDEEDGRDQSHGNTYQNLSPPNGSVPHPGHRYFTPQPAKRKALKPNLSAKPQVSTRPPVFQKPQTPPVQENGSRQPKLTLTIPKRTGTFGHPSLDSGERTGSLDESFDSGTGSASAGIPTKKAMKPPSAQSRGSLFKTSSITSTPTTPGSNVSVFTPDGLRVTPEYQEDEPLQPKRKAPTKPPIGRRKSDPLCNSRIRRAATLTDERQRSNDVDDENSKPKVSRNRTLEGGISPSEMEKYSGNRHRYFTPQPSRRKFSFRDGQGRVVSGNSSPAANFQQPYTRSPVERLANQMRSTKALDRPPSSETMSPETTPVNSPVKKPRTPTKAAPPPPNQASKNKPEPYDFVTDEEVNAAQRHVGGARRSRSLSGSSIQSKRRPLPSVPHRPRSGSASRADKDIPTVSSKAIQRKRRNRQSAPAGRVASILIDSNTSLHNAAAHSGASTAPGEKRRETLREELLRSLVDGTSKKEPSTLPIKKAGDITGEGMVNGVDNTNSLKQVEDSLKINMVREKSGYDEPDTAPRISPLPNKKNSVSAGGGTPTPPSSPGNSPSRQHPRRRRNKSSLSSLVSMPKNLVASNEFLNDILLSDRGSHKKLKAIVGFLVGLILGGLLFLGLYYGLDYPIYPALIITLVATAFMALSLAFTVRARCVAALMVPTICTSRGRAAFLTFIVTLLLRGPIHNIYLNSNEVSASMSCSAQLAYNQTREIQETAQRVLDAYVKGLLSSIDQIEDVVGQVQHLFEPVESGLDILNQGLDQASEALLQAANSCSDVVGSTYTDCTEKVGRVHADCMDFFSQQDILEPLDEICKIFDVTPVCAILDIGQGVCRFPSYVDETIDNSLAGTRRALQTAISKFSPDLDFSHVSEKIVNQSTTSELIQEAIQQELDKAYSKIDWVLAISDKILALSFVWLCIKSYMYHTSYRYKDSFDNQYITAKFKKLDSSRKERGASHLLPLKRHEKNQLIDVTALRLSKSEKQYLTLGLSRVLLHAIIAVILMLTDFFLYWLLLKIQEHGRYEVDFSAGTEASFGINFGIGAFSNFLRLLFAEGFEATTVFNTTLNTTQCLPQPIPPNNNLAIAISFLYATTIVMVLSQAYARRLLRYIAAYYYPEREKERTAYLYRRTLQKRQTIRKMLRDAVKMNKKERDANERVSITAYLARNFPFFKSFLFSCGFKKLECLGCRSHDYCLLVYCSEWKCDEVYCEECARALRGKCIICDGLINLWQKPEEAEHQF